MSGSFALVLSPDPAAVSAARSAVARALRTSTREVVDDACLITSELVTNAVRHGSGDVLLTLENEDEHLIITVTGAAASDPQVRQASTEASSGRGLAIVAALADEWGWRREGEHVAVWARLRDGAAPTR